MTTYTCSTRVGQLTIRGGVWGGLYTGIATYTLGYVGMEYDN